MAPIDEADTSDAQLHYFRAVSNRIEGECKRRRINFYGCESVSDAQRTVVGLVSGFRSSKGITRIGFGDSVTLHQLDIFNKLKAIPNIELLNPFERTEDGKYTVFGRQPPGRLDLPKDEYFALMGRVFDRMRESLLADIFIVGANAITRRGQIVSTDGVGNRVGGMIFGPRRVIIVVGKNKITEDVDSAIRRNRDVAAPLNYFRHNEKHHNRFENPCMKLGHCADCLSERRACWNTVIIDGAIEFHKDRLHLVLVNENLGL